MKEDSGGGKLLVRHHNQHANNKPGKVASRYAKDDHSSVDTTGAAKKMRTPYLGGRKVNSGEDLPVDSSRSSCPIRMTEPVRFFDFMIAQEWELVRQHKTLLHRYCAV